jgi:predicted transcriptional regulator
MLFPNLDSIKHKRVQLQLTQKQLAKESGISQSLIAKIEAKKVSPSYEIVKKIFETFERLEHKKDIPSIKFISRKLISVQGHEKVSKAAELMKHHAISQLPIFQQGKVVGTISESTIYNQLLTENKKKLFSKSVKEIMEDSLPIISAETPETIAMPLLKTNPAILLTEKSKIIGILTKEDFIVKS